MSAYLNSLREGATREDLLDEIERHYHEKTNLLARIRELEKR